MNSLHKTNVAAELSKASGITPQQAEKVLALFRFDKLVERVNAIEQSMADPKAQIAMGMINEDVAPVKRGELRQSLTLDNLRLVPSRHAILNQSVLHLIAIAK